MIVSVIRAVLPCPAGRIWHTVTDLQHYGWRSDLSRLEVQAVGRFVEYTRQGFPTTFTVTAANPCRRWAFTLENENLRGRWQGIFWERQGKTAVLFTEWVEPKAPVPAVLIRLYLKQQQRRYLADLRRALGC